MDKIRVDRMLALGRVKREGSLSPAESEELEALRQEYLADFRQGFRQQLDMVYIQQEDGSYKKLQKKTDTPDDEGDA